MSQWIYYGPADPLPKNDEIYRKLFRDRIFSGEPFLIQGRWLQLIGIEYDQYTDYNLTITKTTAERTKGLFSDNPLQIEGGSNYDILFPGEFDVYIEFTPKYTGDYLLIHDDVSVHQIYYTMPSASDHRVFAQSDYIHLDAGVPILFSFREVGPISTSVRIGAENLGNSNSSNPGSTTSSTNKSEDGALVNLPFPVLWLLPAFVLMVVLRLSLRKTPEKSKN
jgi:hypothetical protein